LSKTAIARFCGRYTDRRERTQPHQYLAVAGDDQHAAIGLGQRGAIPTIVARMPGDTPGDEVPVKPYSRMNRMTSVRCVAAQNVVPAAPIGNGPGLYEANREAHA
jgi:hypothetical protein